MQAWHDLVNAALIGTERQAAPLSPLDGALGEALAALDPADREGRLLSGAGLMAVWQEAGRRPVAAPPLPEACRREDLPRCSPRAARYLAQILAGTHSELLPEWLEGAAAQGRRAPEALLHLLLAAGQSNRALRPGIQAVLGRRGRWLAAQNPQWSYVAGEIEAEDASVWETGSRETRLAYLRKVREADPERARTLLEEVWSRENARDRSAFLEALRIGLSPADEAFLETRLDDRSKEVRATAADLLASLPDAALVVRMREQVRQRLELQRYQVIRWRLDVELPTAFTPEMARDGIEEKPPVGTGERAWWLLQMLGMIPPSTWCREWKKTPAELLEAAALNRDWHDLLIDGWSRASKRHRDPEWAERLLEHWLKRNRRNTLGPQGWAEALTPAALERVILALLEDTETPLNYSNHAVELLSHCPRPWSEALSRGVLERLRADPDGLNPLSQTYFSIAPTVLEEATQGWPELKDWKASLVERFINGVQFRREMLWALENQGEI